MKLTTLFYSFKMAIRSLFAYRLRSGLTSLGVTMGVATVISILSIIEGLDNAFVDAVSSMGTGTIYVSQRPWIILGDWWKYRNRPPITPKDADVLADRVSTAKIVVPFVFNRVQLESGFTKIPDIRVIGTTEHWTEMSGIEPKEGRFIGRADLDSARPVVAIGADVANQLRSKGVMVGDLLKVGGFAMRIVGELPPRGRVFGRTQDDYVVIPLSLFERLYGVRRSMTIGVVTDPENLVATTSEITGALRARRKLSPTQEDNFSLNQQDMLVDVYNRLTRALYATAFGLAIITLIVAGVGIMNIMLVAVAERTKEIGIRKALGARPSIILLQFLVEATLVSGLGGLLGTLFGAGVAKGLDAVTPLPASVPSAAIAAGIAFGLFVGVVFGLLPAYRASRLLPVEALSQGG
ncbi:MAG: ABC transporter permease [Myxococcota bacterium]